MATSLNRFVKHPSEVIDYDFIFTDWLNARNDNVASFTVTADAGITASAGTHSSGVVKTYISGGTAGRSYKIACTVTSNSTPARVKRGVIRVRVRG